MSQALERVYASAPTNEFAVHTLELSHPAFTTPYRFVQAYDDLTAKLETGATVKFQASGIGLSLPKRSVQGREDLIFQLDNVSGEAIAAIRNALEAGGTVEVIYRVYLSNDLTAPAERAVRLVATAARANIRSVAVVATFRDFVNKAWPRRRYTPQLVPGLKYVNG